MKFEPVVWEMLFKDIFIWSSGGPFVQPSGTICAILVEVIMRNNCNFFLNLDQWFRKCLLKKLLSVALVTLLFSREEPFVQFWYRVSRTIL